MGVGKHPFSEHFPIRRPDYLPCIGIVLPAVIVVSYRDIESPELTVLLHSPHAYDLGIVQIFPFASRHDNG
jgi:hypothetical protein